MAALLRPIREDTIETFRQAEMEAVRLRIEGRLNKLMVLRERIRDLQRLWQNEDWLRMLDQQRLWDLFKGRAKIEIPPLEGASDE